MDHFYRSCSPSIAGHIQESPPLPPSPPPKALSTILFRMRRVEELLLRTNRISDPEITTCVNVVKNQGEGFPMVADHISLFEEMLGNLKDTKLPSLEDRSLFMVAIFMLLGELGHLIQLDMSGRVRRDRQTYWPIHVGEVKVRYTSASFKKAKQ